MELEGGTNCIASKNFHSYYASIPNEENLSQYPHTSFTYTKHIDKETNYKDVPCNETLCFVTSIKVNSLRRITRSYAKKIGRLLVAHFLPRKRDIKGLVTKETVLVDSVKDITEHAFKINP